MSQTLSRGLDTMIALGDGPQTIGDIADRLDVHHSTALRLLHTLENNGFVYRHDGRYRLGARLAWLGQLMLEQVDLRSVARAHIEKLASTVGETVHLATLIDGDVIYVDKVESIHPVRMYSQVGKQAPLHCTGVAKAITASNPRLRQIVHAAPQPYQRFTPQTRLTFASLEQDFEDYAACGYLLDDREHEASIHCIATGVLGSDGVADSAISITVPVHRCDRERLESFAPALLEAARNVSRELGHYSSATR